MRIRVLPGRILVQRQRSMQAHWRRIGISWSYWYSPFRPVASYELRSNRYYSPGFRDRDRPFWHPNPDWC